MGLIATLISFTPGTDIKASEANSNNAAIVAAFNGFAVLTDVARSIVAQHTFAPGSAQPPFLLGSNAQGQLVPGLKAASAVLSDTTTALATPRTINGVTFDGTGNITVPVAANALTGTTLAAGVTVSSLQVLGTLLGLDVAGTVSAITYIGSGAGLTNLPAANLTGTLPAISGANLTSLNGANISSGNIASARVASAFATLLAAGITTLGVTTQVVGGNSPGASAVLTLENGAGGVFLAIASGTDLTTNSAPAGTVGNWLKVRIGVTDYRIALQAVT